MLNLSLLLYPLILYEKPLFRPVPQNNFAKKITTAQPYRPLWPDAYARPFVYAGCSVHDITAYDNLALKLPKPIQIAC